MTPRWRYDDTMPRKTVILAPRAKGTVRLVSSVASQCPVSEDAPRLSSLTLIFTFYPCLRGDHTPPQRSSPETFSFSDPISGARALPLPRLAHPLRALAVVVVIVVLLLLRRRRARPRRRRRLRASHRSAATQHLPTPLSTAARIASHR